MPTNIVEGSRQQHRRDFARFLNIAEGSLGEVDYLLMLSRDLDYVDEETTRPLIDAANEIARMLYALCLTTAAEPLLTFAASVREPASLVGCGSAAL